MRNRTLAEDHTATPTAAALAKMTYEERQELIRRLQQEVEDALKALSSPTANIYFIQN